MLSDNIRNYRKKNYLSQDELAEKVGVSRQSVSFWENGQTQPTIDNIIALSKIFNISSDTLLGNSEDIDTSADKPQDKSKNNKNKIWLITGIGVAAAIVIFAIILVALRGNENSDNGNSLEAAQTNSSVQSEAILKSDEIDVNVSEKPSNISKPSDNKNISSAPATEEFDLFTYCKNFAIKIGALNGDYCIYQQPAIKYGGYENEYFSISYWADSDMVEFCLHCPLSETQSHNFYLRMRGGYNGKYEYLSSKYYRDSGIPFRNATGYIDPTVFSETYPISCDKYDGDADGQTEFMEQSRIGICDLIRCLKDFVKTENMECSFSDFDFINF